MFDDIICMDRYNNTVRSLVQWDLDQTLYIYNTNYPVEPAFHYSNQNTDKALVVQSHYVNGVLQCIVPNQLMVEPYPITCYIYIPETEKGGTVVGMFKIPVRPRPQPDEFEYEDNVDVVNIRNLAAEVEAAEFERNIAENQRISHENTRESNESTRESNESIRVSNENTRVSNESTRQTQYNAMVAATNRANTVAAEAESIVDQFDEQYFLKSEGWAVETQNGQQVGPGSPYYHNSAKYWAERAQAISAQSLGGLTDVSILNPRQGQVLAYDGTSLWTNQDPTSEGHLSDAIADTFDPTLPYLTKDVVIYEDKLYRFITSHAAGAWNPNQVEEITVEQLISEAEPHSLTSQEINTLIALVAFD